MDTLKNGLSKIVVNGNADDFAKAILTTDTATKTIAVTETLDVMWLLWLVSLRLRHDSP